MRINTENRRNFKGILTNKFLLKSLEATAKNGALVSAGASLGLSTICRPLSIMATPKADKTDKQYACSKSLASSAVGFGLMFAVTSPIVKAIEKIDKNPSKYLTPETIKNLTGTEKNVTKSSAYKFATQLFKLGAGVLTTYPKAVMTTMFIPAFMSAVFHKTKKAQEQNKINQESGLSKYVKPQEKVSFKGKERIIKKSSGFIEKLASKFASIINKPKVQEFSKKHSETNFAQHIFSGTDILTTGFSASQIAKTKKIEQKNKKTLILNSTLSCGLTIGLGYGVNKLLDKPTEKFIEKFKQANQTSPKLDKYVEGIKIAKPILILGTLYYIAIPILSTFLADKFNKQK